MFTWTAWAQDKTITGRVVDTDTGEPIPGISVFIRGGTQGTVTDVEGNYSLSVPNGAVLVFQGVGMETQEVSVGDQTVIDIQLNSSIKQLGEVVITAIGIERETEALTYAVKPIEGEQIAQKATPDVFSALQGKVPGLQIFSSSGAPGASSKIVLRGNTSFQFDNQPLIVVDGIPIDNSTINTEPTVFGSAYANRGIDLNPQDIESINVLQGPSAAALYGSRAANGAIIITTKRPKAGDRFSIVYTSVVSLNRVAYLPKFQMNMGKDYREDTIHQYLLIVGEEDLVLFLMIPLPTPLAKGFLTLLNRITTKTSLTLAFLPKITYNYQEQARSLALFFLWLIQIRKVSYLIRHSVVIISA
ncbi:MAG: TonB-dependent receptor plug domain-containing protein [Bacteroidia bacterium]|nr:TonB-dependent receptor plug domain-containing protein [Bacteroidia bacterium]